MTEEVKVPSMGESIAEAVIGKIFKESGSFVKAEEELLEIETDKLNQVLYAPVSGIVHFSVKVEEVVSIGQTIATIEPKEEETAPREEVKQKSERKEEPKEKTPVKASSRIGVEAFIEDLKSKEAKSKQSPLPVSDVSQTSKENPEERVEVRKKMSPIRKVIAQRLLEAKQSTAMLTTFNEVDMTRVNRIRKQHQERFQKDYGIKLGYMSFFVKAVVLALKKFPEVNAYIDGDDLVYRHYFNIGIAVGTQKGLIVPVVRNCDRLGFSDIEKQIADLAQKARSGKLVADDLRGAGFTITNGGVYGSLLSTPILNPPQSAILGMHTIKERPVAIEGKVEVRPMMYIALSYDHRVIDGQEAVSFLVEVKKCLEEPGYLLLEE